MPIFDIWCEGYRATGDGGPAHLMGTWSGVDFRDAVVRFMESEPGLKRYFNEENLTFWGCMLFDNEADARASFG